MEKNIRKQNSNNNHVLTRVAQRVGKVPVGDVLRREVYGLAGPPTAAHLQRPGHVAVDGVGVGDGEGGRVGGLSAVVEGPGAAVSGPVGRNYHRHAPEEGPAACGAVQHGRGAAEHHLGR